MKHLAPFFAASISKAGLMLGLLLLAAGTAHAQSGPAQVTTLAGSTQGFQNGPGANALFGRPNGVAVDANGNVYVADRLNHQIRKVTPAGVVSTFAGSVTPGFQDGPSASARFNDPLGVAVDANGNVYVADTENQRIRKITPAGDVTTLAGSGIYGFQDGPGASARFATPIGVAVDASGNVYVGDRQNQRVRKITPAGDVTTLAGSTSGFQDGPGASALFRNLFGVAVDANGNVYVADYSNHRIRKITPAGVVTTFAGSGIPGFQDGPGASARFNGPFGVAVDANGDVFVADEQNQRIRKITPAGVVTTLAGSGILGFQDGPVTSARFDTPRGVAFDANGNVYVGDQFNNRIRRIGSANTPAMANAGVDFSVNEGQAFVTLNGSGSSDPDNDPLTYAWVQLSGTPVTLSSLSAQQPTFTAPTVALGGATLTFQLTVTANGESDTDTVNVTVVNVNHPPVAEAGLDQSIAEGSPVTLDGEDSFDIDNDVFSYAWVQVSGSPTVTLTGADTAQPMFTAPVVNAGGAPGVVATLVFELTVNDGFPQDAPAPGYGFGNVVDRVTVAITNVNNDPVAAAGQDETSDENEPVMLSGTASSDPDSDTLTYAWVQVGTPTVTLSGADTASPTFTAPFVSTGGADLEFELTVDDGYGGTSTDTVVVHVQNANDPPLASAARPSQALLWPPNHGMVAISILGVTDADNNATITITGVTQDEATSGLGDGDTPIDAIINADGTVLIRAERAGNGNGRVYHIHFTASDLEGSTSGVVRVSVPHNKKSVAVDGGALHVSTAN